MATRWSSTFTLILNAYKVHVILSSINFRVNIVWVFATSNEVCDRLSAICKFFDFVASLIEFQSGSSYVTLSMTVEAFQSILSQCKSTADRRNPLFENVAQQMTDELFKHDSVSCIDMANLAEISVSLIENHLLADS